MGQVLSAITAFLEAIKDFFIEIYRFFTVRGRLLKKLQKVEEKVDDIIKDKIFLEDLLEKGPPMIPTLRVDAQRLVDRITEVKETTDLLRDEFEREGQIQLYYNEEAYTNQIEALDDIVDRLSREVKTFQRLYISQYIVGGMAGNQQGGVTMHTEEETTMVVTNRRVRHVNLLISG